LSLYIHIYTHTECPGENVPDFGRMFLKLKYTAITKNTYPKLNGYGDKGERKVWFSCGSTYCTWFAWRIMRTLRMSVLVCSRLKDVHAATAHVNCLEP